MCSSDLSKSDPDVQSGRTEGGKIVFFRAERDMTGMFARVQIQKTEPFAFFGELVE